MGFRGDARGDDRMQDKATVVFVMAHACPLKCDFCCHPREVVGPKRLDRATLAKWMIRFAQEPPIRRFCFTGGEPFLYLEDIKCAVAEAREAGVTQPFHIVTAAPWAKSKAQVQTVLLELRSLGMDLIGLSYDHEHAKWVKSEQILWVIDVAAELGLRVNLNGVFWNVDESISDLLPTDKLPGEVKVTSYLAAPAGRAKKSKSWPRRYDLPNDRKYTCGKPAVYDITIYPDGEVYPCCSGGFNKEGKLSCGNINKDTAKDILRSAFSNFHVRMVKEFGWGVLYSFIRKNDPELYSKLPRFEDVDGVCEICQHLNAKMAPELRPAYAEIEAEYARSRAELEWKKLDEWSGVAQIRSFGRSQGSLSEILQRLTSDQALRRDYLAGTVRLGGNLIVETEGDLSLGDPASAIPV